MFRQYRQKFRQLPQITQLEPDTAEIGGDDVEMLVRGSDFTPDSVIIFNGGEEATNMISAGALSTIVKPALAEAAVSVPVLVRTRDHETLPLSFTFTETETKTAKKGKK